MSFMEAVQTALSKYADFTGRARRSEYWYFYLGLVLVNVLINALDRASSSVGSIVGLLFFAATIVPWLAVAARRLHDTGKTGWWLLLILIPIAGWIALLVFYLLDSTPGDNQYGVNPKAA